MAERKISTKRISRIKRALANGEVAQKGNIAAIETADGTLIVSKQDTTIFPLGYFEDSFTGDGTKKMSVKLFGEIELHAFANDGTIADDDLTATCYLHSSSEVSLTSTGKSIAGRVWEVESSAAGGTVWVQMLQAP